MSPTVRSRERRRSSFVIAQTLLFSLAVTTTPFLLPTTTAWTASTRRPVPSRSACGSRTTRLYTSLGSMTVKELRQMVKDTTDERGVLSRLKRKQDLVDYLQEKEPTPEELPAAAQANVNGDLEQNNDHQEKTALAAPRKAPLNMAPLPLEHAPEEVEEASRDSESPPLSTTHMSPKDVIFEKVYARYPSLRDAPAYQSVSPAEDVRQVFHPIFRDHHSVNNDTHVMTSTDMDVVFVGTASCTPGVTRGVSCTALRLNWRRQASFLNPATGRMEQESNFQGGTWLFDVGECTQLQVQRTISVRPSKITKIFVTHAHGDHTFGLPGLLCLMGQDRDRENSPPVEIYGPEGLRMWLRVAIRYSMSRIVPPYRVHEIMNVPMAPEWEFNSRTRRFFYRGRRNVNGDKSTGRWGRKGLAGDDPTNWISQANKMQLEPSSLYGEIEGGRDIYPDYDHPLSADGAPVWEVEDEDDVKVYAAPMSHGVPCVGYSVEELERPGRLRSELVEPIVKRNVKALREAGFKVPMKAMAVIKNLSPGSSFTFPDGTVVTQEDAVEPPRQGRKVVICGDTADSRAMINLATNADVVIHEATNTYLAGIDKDTNARSVQRDAVVHGHSTPAIAGEFARQVNAKRLVLNHFSARYKGDTSIDSMSIMMRIEMQAIKASGLNETQVATAWDLMVLPVPHR